MSPLIDELIWFNHDHFGQRQSMKSVGRLLYSNQFFQDLTISAKTRLLGYALPCRRQQSYVTSRESVHEPRPTFGSGRAAALQGTPQVHLGKPHSGFGVRRLGAAIVRPADVRNKL